MVDRDRVNKARLEASFSEIPSLKDRTWIICLIISSITALGYGLIDLHTAFSGDWIVQDDARQHVFWLFRFLDPELFPNDAIADYFQSVAPWGYTTLYKLGISFGIDPFTFSKLIPIPIRIAVAYFFFSWCRTIFPVSYGCLIATLLFNHSLWLKDDIVSATPRAFLYSFFLAFLYYFNQQTLIPCLISLVCLSLFYPQMILIAWGMLLLKLVSWRGFIPYLNKNEKERNFAIVGLIVGFLVLLPYALKTSDYAPVISRAEAFTMPEFHYGGRSNFFKDSIWEYLVGRGNGVLISTGVFKPVILVIALFLPLLFSKSNKFSLVNKITPNVSCISKLILASLGMYLLAHIVLFRLHLPSRYTVHSLRIVVNLTAGITIAVWLHYFYQKWQRKYSLRRSKLLVTAVAIALFGIAYINFLDSGSPTGYKIGSYPDLYGFLQQQPKTTMVASLAKEADNLPSFAKRSVLVSREYAIPYQLGYYKPFSQKVRDLMKAQYSEDTATLQTVIEEYSITHWLIEDRSFDLEYVEKNRWLRQFEAEQQKAIANLKSNAVPVVLAQKDRCTLVKSGDLILLDAKCLYQTTTSS